MTQRRQEARNAVELSVMFGFVVLAAAQLRFGPEGSAVLLELPGLTQKLFAVLLFLGAGSVLVSSVVRGKVGAYFERSGMLGCGIALAFYTFVLPETIPSWNTTLGLVFGFFAAGCFYRAVQVHRQIRKWDR